MRKINEVFETYNYNQFKLLKNNRLIDKSHVKRLKISMSEKRLFSPILVNERGCIIDGQHRFEAQKDLKVSIPYIIEKGYGEEEAKILNLNTTNWKVSDWERHYCNVGLQDYLAYSDFKQKYKFESDQCQHILTQGESKGMQFFKKGFFKVKNLKVAYRYADQIISVKPYFKHYNERFFVRAMISIFKNFKTLNQGKEYDNSQLLYKLSLAGNSLVKCVDKKAYLRLIEDILNHRVSKKNRIRCF